MAEDVSKDEKTEEATPRRRQEAREKGQVALSTEFVAATMLLAALGLAIMAGGSLAEACGQTIVKMFGDAALLARTDLDHKAASAHMLETWQAIIMPFAAVVIPMLLVGLLVGYGQVGFQIAPKAVALDFSKLNPVKGWGRVFSMRGVVRTILATLKISVVGITMIVIAWQQVPNLAATTGGELRPVLWGLMQVAVRCTAGAMIAILALALIDLAYQRWQNSKDLRMTKQEIKEEYKTTEGDPHLKARIRQIQREMATSRMMDDVPEATVVITNPTHYAVALKYDRTEDAASGRAPVCVAKGVDNVAQRIKKVASENGVLLYEDVPLARALHAQVEIGEQISEDLFQAVAQVLSYVYRMRGEAAYAG